ncbi:hypothetical protein [Candidatus Similichlamydia laticola]|uniref:hypothetical protein n=1 Tax=Candidatus Similichlamydia laticola TaxID=2170265 RepID=UPI001C69A39C|nr:hypothetical protein [Candidatus Similichlamydia laticola]
MLLGSKKGVLSDCFSSENSTSFFRVGHIGLPLLRRLSSLFWIVWEWFRNQ